MSNSEGENEVNEARHSSLLEAVTQLDNKQRVKPPSRKEPSYEVSEFHLVKHNAHKEDVQVNKLAKVLGKQAKSAQISKKLQSFKNKAKTLPPPLEKPTAARIHRSVGFQNVRKQLGRWTAIVERNRASDHLKFPLNQSKVYFRTTDDFVSKIMSQSRTELEAQMDELLNKSPAVQQEKKEREEEFQLTLQEMLERRKELASLRAQQSYMASKASRQKKIKSKKYHRILRRERTKQQLKDFETLQKTDPEAALKQLEQLEKTRAHERVSLRHRSTGQWARNKAVRAKYDKESRQELAQQLAISRDLTQKVKTGDSSDEEEVDDKTVAPTNTDNPWIAPKTSSEVEEFVSGYRKFWEEQNKKSHNKNDKQTVKQVENKGRVANGALGGISENLSLENQKDNILKIPNNAKQIQNRKRVTDEVTGRSSERVKSESSEDAETECKVDTNEHVLKDNREHNDKNRKLEIENVKLGNNVKNKESSKETCNIFTTESKNAMIKSVGKDCINSTREKMENNKKTESMKEKSKVFSNESRSVIKESKRKKKRSSTNIIEVDCDPDDLNITATSDGWLVTPVKVNEKGPKRKKTQIKRLVSAKSDSILKVNEKGPKRKKTQIKGLVSAKSDSKEIPTENSEIEIDNLFANMENTLKRKVNKKLKRVTESMKKDNKHNNNEIADSDSYDEGPSLKMTKTNIRTEIDEELNERAGSEHDHNSSSDVNVTALIAQSNTQEQAQVAPSENIDPNKFIAMKPKHLMTDLPDMVTAGDEGIDDNEDEVVDGVDERQKAISEAFADDDVVADFRKEKEEAAEKSKPKDVDLTLPGWGEWGGKNIPTSNRKKSRFIMKFPDAPPRKDANQGHIIINEEKNDKIKVHQVNELPYPFRSVKDYEASIRAPLGNTWIPETAHRKLIKPQVLTKLGKVIKPMDEDMLVRKKSKIQEIK